MYLSEKNPVPLFKWLREIFDLTAGSNEYPEITRLFEKFIRETKEELWNSEEELSYIVCRDNISYSKKLLDVVPDVAREK